VPLQILVTPALDKLNKRKRAPEGNNKMITVKLFFVGIEGLRLENYFFSLRLHRCKFLLDDDIAILSSRMLPRFKIAREMQIKCLVFSDLELVVYLFEEWLLFFMQKGFRLLLVDF